MTLGGRIFCAVLILCAASIAKCSIAQQAMTARSAELLSAADGKMLTEVFGDIDAVCLVPEYTFTADIVQPLGFKVKKNRYVGELETGLVVLDGSEEDFFLLTTSQGGAYIGNGCFDPRQHRFEVETIVQPGSGETYRKLAVVKVR